MVKLWQKKTRTDPDIEAFTAGDDPVLDLRLVPYDCAASAGHAKMLGRIGVLTADEVRLLTAELDAIAGLAKEGRFGIPREMEDCHTAIENRLTEKLGELGKKIHTGRSRNDQVLAALRLFCIDEAGRIRSAADALTAGLKSLSGRSGAVRIPGYTHTRKAMPSSIGMWAGGYAVALEEDARLLDFIRGRMDQSPLGTGAGYGVPLEVDRALAAKEAGFSAVQENPIAVQLSRGKFESTLVHALALFMLDANRMASDLIFFSMPEVGFVRLPEAFCTGSSIMPQKKNPDVLELVRAKYHAVLACQIQLQTTTAGLISGYHRDLQLTKKPLMEALDAAAASLAVLAKVVTGVEVDGAACAKALTEEVFAAERVYALVKQGVPFREAYRRVGKQYE
ncbi:argininosuccinate lyase [bacterium]|nr:argininosuccinate lyase [bacterium]